MKKLWGLFFLLTTKAWSFDHSHTLYGKILASTVVRQGAQTLVRYSELKKNPRDLDLYITELSKVTVQEYKLWSEKQKLATLINAYNAWTLKLIIDNYPVKSIKDIGPFYSTPWKIKFIRWLGNERSLDDIEHSIIRKEFNEPRIHFALVCASRGCPTLQEVPFLASALDEQLQIASNSFLQDQAENRYKISGKDLTISISKIFKWYEEDFGSEENLKAFVLNGMKIKSDDIKK
jgi:hypothetical protein